MKEKFNVTGMSCAACVSRVEKAVKVLDGIKSVSVNLLSNSMLVEYDDSQSSPEKIISAVKSAGYGASLKDNTPLPTPDKKPEESMKARIIVSVILLLLLMALSMGPMLFGYPLPAFLNGAENTLTRALIQLLLTLPVLYVNRVYFEKGFSSLIRRSPNMDSLIALGASASVIYGIATLFQMSSLIARGNFEALSHLEHNLYFEGAAMIVTLITVGKMLEAKSRRRTGEALSHLMDMTPKTARVLRDGVLLEIAVEEALKGDIIETRAGESFALDGEVIEGEGEADESSITGESIPVTKSVGNEVIGSTVLKSGYIRFRVTRIGSETVFAKIIELVDNAQSGKAPIARLADKIAGVFVPVVIGISIITLAVWLIIGEELGTALTHAISVLVISCPCALGLATPVVITVGTGKGAENGILIKSAEILETLHSVDTVVLDKTGTVTEGRPVMTDVHPISIDRSTLLEIASGLEAKSEHPLSRAVLAGAIAEGVNPLACDNYKTLSGRGIEGVINGVRYLAGNARLMSEEGVDISSADVLVSELSDLGKTPLYFACDKALIGVIAVADTLKKDSAVAITLLRRSGKRTVMLTGDNRRTAEGIGRGLELTEIISDVLPSDKERVIRELQEKGHRVAMVGDGINDAPALTRADVGFAIGSGTDVARDSADVVLMRDSLLGVYDAIRLSSHTIRNIKQNLFWAFFYNCLGIPLAAGVFVNLTGWTLSPMLASLAMSLSSLFVVSNALRLRRFRVTVAGSYITVKIKGMMCERCVSHVEDALRGLDGIERLEVSLKEGSAKLWGNPDKSSVKASVEKAGYKVVKIKD
ncbi:MAG: cadmium-translocating P-type ATPase [Clostridia bacterium]|nr:cadmium-translocating P-type ATPase [Clostridia bacterium]